MFAAKWKFKRYVPEIKISTNKLEVYFCNFASGKKFAGLNLKITTRNLANKWPCPHLGKGQKGPRPLLNGYPLIRIQATV